jgi:prepilin-type N-terminal cleavage/methylation domain-containing protein
MLGGRCREGVRGVVRAPRGFTLVEVLISLTLLATIMAILWGTFSNAYRMRDLANEKYDRYRGVQAALRRMQREISMAFVTKIGEIPTNEAGIVTYQTAYQTAFIGSEDRIDFTNFAHVRTRMGQAASEQAEISYFLRSVRADDGRLRHDLTRREQAPIDGDPEEGGTLLTLLEDVESIEFEYWRPDREIAGDAWERDWDTRETGVTGLPPRVRVTVEVRDPLRPREELTFSVQAEIPLRDPIGFATNVIVPDGEVIVGDQIREIEEVLADESDEPDSNAFEDRVNTNRRTNRR